MPKHRDTEPWERLEGEGVKAYEAFSVYLELGEERSIRAVAKQLNKSTTLIGRWSRTYQWVERTAAYDVDVQRKAHAQAVKKRRKMADRHISIGPEIAGKGVAGPQGHGPQRDRPEEPCGVHPGGYQAGA